jgi:thiamine-phosphate pyrophosphorylase
MRIVDANVNRVCEGLRVIEDIMRFNYNDQLVSSRLRHLRHQIRKRLGDELVIFRNIKNDVGVFTSQSNQLDKKTSLSQLLNANFKRVQEGLRVIEEMLKIEHYSLSKEFEHFRHEAYELERLVRRRLYQESAIYLILGEKFSKGRSNLQVAKEALDAGVKTIQYREKDKDVKDQVDECRQLMELIDAVGGQLIVNDRLDVALAVGAHGVHVGQEDMSIRDVKRIAPHLIVGVSTHSIEQARQAEADGADYIGVGPMFETTTKDNIEPSKGLKYLEEVSNEIKIPYVAIGGIKTEHVKTIRAYGAAVAMISHIVGADSINDRIMEIKKELI